MDEKSTRQLLLTRYYLVLAAAQGRINRDEARFAAINLLHEALEAALIASSEHLNVAVGERTPIEPYLSGIEAKLPGTVLPLRSRVLRFNRIRVSAKHALTLPDPAELKLAFSIIPEFISALVQAVFKLDLNEVNLADLIEDKEIRDLSLLAQQLRSDQKFYDSLAAVRKTLYILYEKRYDISVFQRKDDADKYGLFDDRAFCQAPYYARSAKYVKENVRDPFQFIVLDHARVESELLISGIDVHVFWNIWRLTPAVWRNKDKEWYVKYDVNLAESETLDEDSLYAIDQIIRIILQRQSRRKEERYKDSAFRVIRVRPGAPIYERASMESAIAGNLPSDAEVVHVSEAVQGLDTDKWFWSVYHLRKGGPFLSGYMRIEDTVGELFTPPARLIGLGETPSA